jgi:hypothetical protein
MGNRIFFKVCLLLFFVCSVNAALLKKQFFIHDDKDLKEVLLQNSIPVSKWIESINSLKEGFFCIGESHRDSYRKFLAGSVLPGLKVDKIFFETTQIELDNLLEVYTGSKNAILLNADIGGIFNTLFTNNSNIEMFGVEETKEQELAKNRYNRLNKGDFISRDGFIAQNILEKIEPHKKNFAIYGSYHCSKNAIGLGGTVPFYRHLVDNIGISKDKMKSILLVADERGDFLADYLWRLGLNKKAFVVSDTSKIDQKSYNYSWQIKTYFDNYDTIIFFN